MYRGILTTVMFATMDSVVGKNLEVPWWLGAYEELTLLVIGVTMSDTLGDMSGTPMATQERCDFYRLKKLFQGKLV